jgi:hypothetical protein
MVPKRSVKIVSDGTTNGTKVYVCESDGTFVDIPWIQGVSWSTSIKNSYAKGHIDLALVEVDVIGELND